MKNIWLSFFALLAIILGITSCTKEKNITPELVEKQYFIIKSTSGNVVNRYNRSVNGKLTSIIFSEGTSYKDSVTIRYDANGNITNYNWLIASAPSRNEYTYGNNGKLVSRKGFSKDGSVINTTFTYFDDRMEETRVYPEGNNIYIYYYSPDKKNVDYIKIIGTSGKIAEEQRYKFTTIKAVKFGYEQLSGYENQNAVEQVTTTVYNNNVPGSVPVTTTSYRKYTVNEDGYVTKVEYSASNSTSTSTTIYEYLIK